MNRRTAAQNPGTVPAGKGQGVQQFCDAENARLDTDEGAQGIFDTMHLAPGEGEAFTFEGVRAATGPGDIGLTARFLFIPQTQSLDFEPSGGFAESLRNLTAQSLGVANVWSVAFWSKIETAVDSPQHMVVFAPVSGNVDRIAFRFSSARDGLTVVWHDGATQGTAGWDDFYTPVGSTWVHTLVTWNGTALTGYRNGVDQGAVSTGNRTPSLTMADGNRRVFVGSLDGITDGFEGRIAQISLWRAAVDAAVSDIYAAGDPTNINLNGTFGSYTFKGDLAHWWRPGNEPSPLLGKDNAVAGFTPTIDIETNATNISDADRVADVP